MTEQAELRKGMQKIEQLVGELSEIADPNVRSRAIELVQLLMEMHGAGLERMLSLMRNSGAPGVEVINKIARDDLVASLLLLYGLHPVDLNTRVGQALEKVRPYLKTHGGNVELVGIDDGFVRLRLEGSCHGCPSSAMTLKLAIEEAIYEIAPDIAGLAVEGVVDPAPRPSGLVTIDSSGLDAPSHNGNGQAPKDHGIFEDVVEVASLGSGEVRATQIGETSVLLCCIEQSYYAYGSDCPLCQQSMNGARLELTTLHCPHCDGRFDVMRAGRALDHPTEHLEPFPLLMENDKAKIAVPQFAGA